MVTEGEQCRARSLGREEPVVVCPTCPTTMTASTASSMPAGRSRYWSPGSREALRTPPQTARRHRIPPSHLLTRSGLRLPASSPPFSSCLVSPPLAPLCACPALHGCASATRCFDALGCTCLDPPDVEVLVVGADGHLATVVVLDVLEVVVVLLLELPGPPRTDNDGGDADVERDVAPELGGACVLAGARCVEMGKAIGAWLGDDGGKCDRSPACPSQSVYRWA